MRTQLVTLRAAVFGFAALMSSLTFESALAAPLAIRDTPLFIADSVPPLNMLVVGRDHKLYYEAYNDTSDLDGDGDLDVGFDPQITYFGYFDSAKCYAYDGAKFAPNGDAGKFNTCSGSWSGNWMNYVTTARIDALRKVLYGGKRYQDDSSTVLARTHIPQDAHSWGKEYASVAENGYDISQYTPFSIPAAGRRHLFANTTLLNSANQLPLLRVLTDQSYRIWEWVSIERPVAGGRVVHGGSGPTVTPTDYTVHVQVCRTSMPEANCKQYPNGRYKPTGLLQDYGENDTMLFGLLTGTYQNNTQGGALRKAIGSFQDEVDADSGRFLLTSSTTSPSIIRTLDGFRTVEFGGNYVYSCGWASANKPINNGECRMWGNPLAEMMFETLRYFSGKGVPTSAFASGSVDTNLGLTEAKWDNPFTTHPSCSKPFQTLISDINPSYDTDMVPGSAFSSFSGDIGGLDATTLGSTIWSNESNPGGSSSLHFMGQVGSLYDGAPTPKTIGSFGNIRGLAPEEPTKQGSYYSASMAYFGNITDLNSATGDQKMQTFAVALASPLPKIAIPVGNRVITMVPFAKSVGGSFGIDATQGAFQPTNQIVDFYVESITPTSGRFRVNFEDVEQGADHDMDAIVIYDYEVQPDDTVEIRLTSEYAAGGIIHHLGYVISGSTADGIYLVVRDKDTAATSDPDYFLDTPAGGAWKDGVALPLYDKRSFSPGSSDGATLLKDPLWYAAKWGGFRESGPVAGRNQMPEGTEWDEDGDGTPDSYFLVTNALTLKDQLSKAFDTILKRTGSASSASVNSGTINEETRIYQALFTTGDWSGDLVSYPVQTDGSVGAAEWNAATRVPAAVDRVIFTVNSDGSAVPFSWAGLDATRKAQLDPNADSRGEDRLEHLRGDRSHEIRNGGAFRDRNPITVLGDFVSSSPVFVGKPRAAYRDSLETPGYSSFRAAQESRNKVIYAGANDGMMHAFDASNGEELWAFIPGAIFGDLHELTKPSYSHKFFVDGPALATDAYLASAWKTVLIGGLNNGGQGIYALDVTNPNVSSEANAATKFMWEYTDADDADLGYTYSRPTITRMRNGKWVAIFGNGYNNTVADSATSSTGNAVLYVVDLATGGLLRKIDTGVGMSVDPKGTGRPNGLSTPAVIDFDDDGVADYAYAGDLFGNMWKFDFTSATVSDWDVAFKPAGVALPLFVARDSAARRQPITSRPQVGFGPRGEGMVVVFGTGKFLESSDRVPSGITPQTFYGIWDKNADATTDIVTSRAQLTQQSILFEGVIGTQNARVTSDNALGTNRGWYIDLISPGPIERGEMQVTNSVLRNKRVIFTTLIPSEDPCAYGGTSWLMELDYVSGARLAKSPFDVNGDGEITDADNADVSGSSLPVSGLQSQTGIYSQVSILTDGTYDHAYMSHSNDSGSGDPIAHLRMMAALGAYNRQSWRQIR